MFLDLAVPKSDASPKKPGSINRATQQEGFTLLAVIGILAIMTIMASIIVPNAITVLTQQTIDSELQNLRVIAEGSEVYLRRNLAWPPTLDVHSPDYVPLDVAQLTQNPNGYPRYYVIHPNTVGFSNPAGLPLTDLPDARFLLISDLSQDAAPVITNAAQFETWWDTPETSDLHIVKASMASHFHEVILTASGAGGSYQIDGSSTNSGGGTLSSYRRYHLRGTTIGLDEADTYGNPQIQFALTANLAYHFEPCFPPGTRWRIPPVSPCTGLWLSTTGNTGGTPGLSSWTDAQIVRFSEPSLTYESGPTGNTSGEFGLTFDLDDFTTNADLDAMHYVTGDITVGSTDTLALYSGDLLLSTDSDETLTSTNSLSVKDEDVFVFRPTAVGDYSSGTFLMLLDGSDISQSSLKAFSLVEQTTTVGDEVLPMGSMLISENNQDVLLFDPTSVGDVTSGTLSILIVGSDININPNFSGIEVIEVSTNIGDVTLNPGQVLATLDGDDTSVGDNSLSTEHQDVFLLDLTDAGSSTAGDATLLFEGSDVSLNSAQENLDGLTIIDNST